MAEKARQFVLLSDNEIAWVVGRRTGDDFRLTDKTDKALRITCEKLY
jgi:tRNA(Ile)-lysidine synthase